MIRSVPYFLCAMACVLILFSGCKAQNKQAIQAEEQAKHVIAVVNGENLTEGEFESSEAWLPLFVRQLESNSTIQIQRFWGLVYMMAMAQDARTNHYMSDAERSLAIKEALAKEAIARIQYPPKTFTENEIRAYQEAHPEEFMEPPAFTVAYALVKRESTIHSLVAAYGLVSGAQMGYNYLNPPPKVEDRTMVAGPQVVNEQGYSIDPGKFNFAFATHSKENRDEQALLGPFTASDNLLFSCDKAINILKTAPLNRPITHDMACSGDWKAFVIPEWRREAAPMTKEKARQVAIEHLTADFREKYRTEYLKSL